jgi:hypothetical protein
VLVAHSLRAHQFGRALLARHAPDAPVDEEALYVAAALHDLGLTAAYGADDDGHLPFEQRGAAAAAAAVLGAGGPPARAALVRDAVALHLDLAAARDPRPEVAALHLGALAEVAGRGIDVLPPAFVRLVLHEHPRGACKQFLAEALRREAERRPHSATAQLVREHGLLAVIAAAPFTS